MMAFPSMLTEAAVQAGMKVPENPDDEFDREQFPHFAVFCVLQLGRPINWGEHWENAKVIMKFDEEMLKKAELSDFIERGLQFQS